MEQITELENYIEKQEVQEIEQVPNTYYYDKLYDDKHLGSFTENTQLAHQLGWQNNTVAITDTEVSELNGWIYLKGYAPKKSESDKLNEHIENIKVAVQNVLDETAQSKGYDDGKMLATYVFDDDETFKKEGIAYVKWRGKVWRYCYDKLAEYQSGQIECPSVDDIINNMPKMEW